MRSTSVALLLVSLLPAAGFAQGTPQKTDVVQNPPPPQQESSVSQDDPGQCEIAADKKALLIFPPKTFKAPADESCTTICTVKTEDQSSDFGCDISATPGADGTICIRPLDGFTGQEKLGDVVVLKCEKTVP